MPLSFTVNTIYFNLIKQKAHGAYKLLKNISKASLQYFFSIIPLPTDQQDFPAGNIII